jgi:hypothetical protein
VVEGGAVTAGRALARLRDAIDPFVHPRSTSRKPRPKPFDFPEDDLVRFEITQGDLWRLQVVAGTLTTSELRELPQVARPGVEFLSELEEIEEAAAAFASGKTKEPVGLAPGPASRVSRRGWVCKGDLPRGEEHEPWLNVDSAHCTSPGCRAKRSAPAPTGDGGGAGAATVGAG